MLARVKPGQGDQVPLRYARASLINAMTRNG